MALETVIAFISVMAGLFYLSKVIEHESQHLSSLFKFIAVFFMWIIIGLSGADSSFIALGLTITILPTVIWLFFKFKGETVDRYIYVKKHKDKESYTWGEELDED